MSNYVWLLRCSFDLARLKSNKAAYRLKLCVCFLQAPGHTCLIISVSGVQPALIYVSQQQLFDCIAGFNGPVRCVSACHNDFICRVNLSCLFLIPHPVSMIKLEHSSFVLQSLCVLQYPPRGASDPPILLLPPAGLESLV